MLVAAPVGRDASLIVTALARVGIDAQAMRDVAALAVSLDALLPDAPGAILVTEEALAGTGVGALGARLARQPAWSEAPLIILATAGHELPGHATALERLAPLGAFTVIERPVRGSTLTMAVRAALRSRRRQYETRDGLLARERDAVLLREQAEALERSNAELDQFATIASHDLQEPVRMISGYLGLLRSRYGASLDATASSYIGQALDGATRLSAMIRAILAHSRLGAETTLAPADVQLALGNALANLQAKIERTQAVIRSGPLPTIPSDPTLLTLLFQNLISNAIKFCDRVPEIAIEAREQGDEWLFTVTDNGVGFPKEASDRAFKLFQRFRTDRPGTGIGLATCKKIVDLHHGRIWVEGRPGVGSCFSIALPKGG